MSPRSKKSKKSPPPRVQLPLQDDKVYPIPPFCRDVLGVSVDTFRRICRAGEGPPITRLSKTRIGIRGRHGKEWLDGRAKAAS